MKHLLILAALALGIQAFAQSDFPKELQGTWMMNSEPIFEEWTLLGSEHLKGFSGIVTGGAPQVIEYLDIRRNGKNIVLEAIVPGQNNDEAIYFTMEKQDTAIVFKNEKHDFPQIIRYNFLSKDEISVELSGKGNSMAYKLIKQSETPGAKGPALDENAYDPILAERLQADEFGMKKYYFVLLVTGENTTIDSTYRVECYKGHFANMDKMLAEGKLVLAGPFGKNTDSFRGVFILQNTGTMDETYEYLQNDLAIKAGMLKPKIYSWYGSAAIQEYLPVTRKITKSKMGE